jgi:serine/threonine-protein kinase
MSRLDLAEGVTFARRYRIIRLLALGGMGAVYEAVHLITNRHRALKVMLPELSHCEAMRERFLFEARVTGRIESEYIVDVSDAGVDEETRMLFLVMELLRGENLRDRLRRVQRLGRVEVATYLLQAARALDKTHRESIIHCDLKPENLFLADREGGPSRIKVLDFGIARLAEDGAGGEEGAHLVVGTPYYMAPEQFTAQQSSPAIDIYALGMITFTLLTGRAYWSKEQAELGDAGARATAAAGGPPEPASARARRFGVMLPSRFDAWFARATATFPADRFSGALEAALALPGALGIPRPPDLEPESAADGPGGRASARRTRR